MSDGLLVVNADSVLQLAQGVRICPRDKICDAPECGAVHGVDEKCRSCWYDALGVESQAIARSIIAAEVNARHELAYMQLQSGL